MTQKELIASIDAAVAEAQLAQTEVHMEQMKGLITNKNFIEAQRQIAAKETELKQLNTTIKQLNMITPFVTDDGHKYSIKVYPVSHFGTGLGELMGIISGSRSAFTDELALKYSAITGIAMIELRDAQEALGSPTYVTKEGIKVEPTPTNLPRLKQLLASIMLKTGLFEFNLDSLTQDRIDLWFAKAEIKAEKVLAEYKQTEALNDSQEFTMEG